VLGEVEHFVPQSRLEVALQLREIPVRPRAALDELGGDVKEAQAEIAQRRRDGPPVYQDVLLDEVPATRADHEDSGPRVERVPPGFGAGRRDWTVPGGHP